MHNKKNELTISKSKSCVLKNVISSNRLEGNSLQLFRLIIVNFQRGSTLIDVTLPLKTNLNFSLLSLEVDVDAITISIRTRSLCNAILYATFNISFPPCPPHMREVQ